MADRPISRSFCGTFEELSGRRLARADALAYTWFVTPTPHNVKNSGLARSRFVSVLRTGARSRWVALLVFPAVFYFGFFCFYTWPWILHFSDAFFGDGGDGFQNAWNLWWVHRSGGDGGNIWFTTFLHYPYGTSLLGHTLSPLNSLAGAVLMNVLSLVQAYNLVVIGSFVATGITTFWLCYHLCRAYFPSLLGGFIFTFSSYHFAHAYGHMNLISLQWIPLFLLGWWMFLKKPSYLLAMASAGCLFLNAMTDWYYFLYCVIAGAVLLLFFVVSRRLVLSGELVKRLSLFIFISGLSVAPLLVATLRTGAADPFTGAHDAVSGSANLLSPFINGQIWYFNGLTKWYWSHAHLGIVEGSVSLGATVLVLVALGTLWRKRLGGNLWPWFSLMLVFGVLSLGPSLNSFGEALSGIPLPYAWLVAAVPPLQLAGMPVRMMVMAILAAAVIAACVLALVASRYKHGTLAVMLAAVLIGIECAPSALPFTSARTPEYVGALKDLPPGGLIDLKDGATTALYYQTVHNHPLAFGYISRTPSSVARKDKEIQALIDANEWDELSNRYCFTYLLAGPDFRPLQLGDILYRSSDAVIYHLMPGSVRGNEGDGRHGRPAC